MSERINLAAIERKVSILTPLLPPNDWAKVAVSLIEDDLPALVAWVKEARDALMVARNDAEHKEWDARVSLYAALLFRLEEKP